MARLKIILWVLGFAVMAAGIVYLINKKPFTKPTSVDIKSIQEIGFLITSVYYGEVLESYQETLDARDDPGIQLKKLQATYTMYRDTLKSIAKPYAADARINNAEWLYIIKEFTNEPFIDSESFLSFQNAISVRKKKFRQQTFIKEYLYEQNWIQFYRKHKEQMDDVVQESIPDGNRNINFAYLGRGSVKAGINLKKILPGMLKVEDNKLYIIGLDPEVISVDINPYFLYDQSEDNFLVNKKDKSNYGFELIYLTKPARVNRKVPYEDVLDVKINCVRKLRHKALERDILKYALYNAEESLHNFFDIINFDKFNDVPFDSVKIIPSKYFALSDSILVDEKIDAFELKRIKEVVKVDDSDLSYDSFYYDNYKESLAGLLGLIDTLNDHSMATLNDTAWATFYMQEQKELRYQLK